MEEDNGQYDHSDEIFHAKGAAIAVRKSVTDEVGLFDETFFINYEDVDLCWRIWLRGYRVVFCPRSIVYHKSRAVTRRQKNMFHSAINLLKYSPPLISLGDRFIPRSSRSEKIRRVAGYNQGNPLER